MQEFADAQKCIPTDGQYGTRAWARKKCTSATTDIYFCGDLCMAAKDLWNMRKAGVFNRTDTK